MFIVADKDVGDSSNVKAFFKFKGYIPQGW